MSPAIFKIALVIKPHEKISNIPAWKRIEKAWFPRDHYTLNEIFCTQNAHIFTIFLKGYVISNLNKVVMTRNWTVDNYVMTKTVLHVLNYTRLDIFEQKRLSAQEIFAASSIVSFQLNSFSMNETWIWNMWAALKSCKATFFKKQKTVKICQSRKTCQKYKLPPHFVGNILLHVLIIFLHPLVLPVQQPLSITSLNWEFVPTLSDIWQGS